MSTPRRRGRLRRGSGSPPPPTPRPAADDSADEATQGSGDGSTADIGVQVDFGNEPLFDSKCVRLLLGGLSLAIGVVLAVLAMETSVSFFDGGFGVDPEMIEELGMEGIILFRQHDRNSDGFLSLEEFEPVAHRLTDVNETFTYDLPIEDWDEMLTIQTFFQPLLFETLSKDVTEHKALPGHLDSLKGLKTWKSQAVEWQNFGASHFKGFLPTDEDILNKAGNVYYIIPVPEEMARGPTLSSNRYFPPMLLREGEIIVHRLLALFHPRTFVYSRFAPQGSVACVRAVNEDYVDIMFRIHAEFQLNEAPFYPFWFTPGQFAGNLIISRNASRVLAFNLYVPTKNRLNVDMEWLNAPLSTENMEVDIGFMPQMELKATCSSVHIIQEQTDKEKKDIFLEAEEDSASVLDDIKWIQEIDPEVAARKLEVQLYRFKQVPYYNLTESLRLAQEQNKLIHSIMLWGVLDDQSC